MSWTAKSVVLIAFVELLLFPFSCPAQLSQNSGISSADTWVAVDLSIGNNTTINLPQPIYNAATQSYSSTLSVAPTIETFHVEAGYDSSGALVMNLWPKNPPSDPITSDGNPLGFIRFAGGQMTIFDQSGAPMSPLSLQGIPTNWPLSFLGSNPGPSVISNLVVSNISTYSTAARAQLAYATAPSTAYVSYSTPTGSTAKWTYAQSGSAWVAQQVVLTPMISNGSSTRTVNFANMSWHDNPTQDSARAAKGYTAQAPPSTSSAIPAVTTSATPLIAGPCNPNCSLGGTQNVAFMHGIHSNGATWDRMVPWLNRDFRFGTELTPTYSSMSSLSSQGANLVSDIQKYGGSGYVLVGHSQGGLISRYAAQYFQKNIQNQAIVSGVVTVDTPHQGADLILNGTTIGPTFYAFGQAMWYWVGCSSQWDNAACFLAWLVYNAGPPMGAGFIATTAFPAIDDLIPGSSFLVGLNGYSENFRQAAIIGNTPQRWNEARVTWDFLAPFLPIEAVCDPNYYPESWCGERTVATVLQVGHDIVEGLLAFAILEEIFDPSVTIFQTSSTTPVFWLLWMALTHIGTLSYRVVFMPVLMALFKARVKTIRTVQLHSILFEAQTLMLRTRIARMTIRRFIKCSLDHSSTYLRRRAVRSAPALGAQAFLPQGGTAALRSIPAQAVNGLP